MTCWSNKCHYTKRINEYVQPTSVIVTVNQCHWKLEKKMSLCHR